MSLDPTVRGSINVRSYDLLNEKQYYQFFLNVLEVYGFAIVEMESGIIKVIKAKDAKVSAIPVVDDGRQFKGDENGYPCCAGTQTFLYVN